MVQPWRLCVYLGDDVSRIGSCVVCGRATSEKTDTWYYRDEWVCDWHLCPDCDGLGYEDEKLISQTYAHDEVEYIRCKRCDGRGYIQEGIFIV